MTRNTEQLSGICHRAKCKKVIPVGRTKYCSDECMREGQQEALKKLGQQRRGDNVDGKTPCSICGTMFKPIRRNGYKRCYCSDPCKQAGLQMAIERQRLRREEIKLANAQARANRKEEEAKQKAERKARRAGKSRMDELIEAIGKEPTGPAPDLEVFQTKDVDIVNVPHPVK